MNYYDLGDVVRISGAFTDIDGAAQDPTVVLFDWITPAGVTTTYTYLTDAEVVKDSTGNYHVDVDCDEVGLWRWHWYSTGTGQASDEGSFRVSESEFD